MNELSNKRKSIEQELEVTKKNKTNYSYFYFLLGIHVITSLTSIPFLFDEHKYLCKGGNSSLLNEQCSKDFICQAQRHLA